MLRTQAKHRGACQEDIFEKPVTLVESERGNFNNKYPILYYKSVSFFANDEVVKSTLLIRGLNLSLFLAITLIFLFKLPRNLFLGFQRVVLFSLVPLGLFFIPSINPTSWTITGVLTTFFAVAGYLHQSNKISRKILFIFLAFIGLFLSAGSRADGSIYALVAIACALVLFGGFTKKKLLQIFTPILIFIGGLFFLLSFNPSIFTPGTKSLSLTEIEAGLTERSFFQVFFQNLIDLPEVWLGLFGSFGLGWLDTPLPATISLVVMSLTVATIFQVLPKINRIESLVISFVFLGLILVPLVHLQLRLAFIGESFQSRYIFPLFILLLSVLFSVRPDSLLYASRKQTFVVWIGLTTAQSLALLMELSRYVNPAGGIVPVFSSSKSNWWWDISIEPSVFWILGSLSFSILCIFVLTKQSTETQGNSASSLN